MPLTVKQLIPKTLPITPVDKLPLRGMMELEITFDSAYPDTGEPIDFNKHFYSLGNVIIEGKNGYTFWYDKENKLLHAYLGGVEPSGGPTDLSALSKLQVTLFGE